MGGSLKFLLEHFACVCLIYDALRRFSTCKLNDIIYDGSAFYAHVTAVYF